MSDSPEEKREEVPLPTVKETPEPTLASLAARVEQLEIENEGLKTKVLVGLVLTLLLGGAVAHQTWADLSGLSTGGIAFHDSDNETQAALTINSGHLALVPKSITGSLAQLRPTTGLDIKGLGIYDSQGYLRIVLGVNSHDDPRIAILDPSGRATWVPLPNVPPAPKTAAKGAPGAAAPKAPAATATP